MPDAFGLALGLIAGADPDFTERVAFTPRVSLTAVIVACALGRPLGAFLAVTRFRGREAMIAPVNALIGLSSVRDPGSGQG